MHHFIKYHTLYKLAFVFILPISIGFACQRRISLHKNRETNDSGESASSSIKFSTPKPNQVIRIGAEIPIQLLSDQTLIHLDSIQFLLDGRRIGSSKQIGDAFTWATAHANAGTHHLSITVYDATEIKCQATINIKLFPKPSVSYTYKVVNTFPHDKSAYTQGLVYDNGYLLESTGLYGASTLRRVAIQSGEPITTHQLPNDIFGEGLTAFDNKLIQITWKEQVAFIYDKSSFNLLNKITYPIKEGWGITYNGKHLIFSDGSAYLYFLNKKDLTEEYHIEVCDEHGPVGQLNELEYIDGEIWANVYTTDTVVRIDPKSGAVVGKIDMSGLLKPNDRQPNTNVLNGIAYDSLNKSIWVTGKNWPKLFQITVEQTIR